MKNECEKYELAITNFVLGEKMNISESELFNHLAKCKNCQGDLRNWRATHAVLCAKEYDSKPEIKQRNEAFIKNLVYGKHGESPKTTGPVAGKPELPGNRILIDIKSQVMQDTKTLYNILKTDGEQSLPILVKKSNLKEYRVKNAICCMGIHDMVVVSKDDKTAYVKLQPGA